MGGKSSTSSQSVSIPPEVLARYNSVNARAEEVAKTPFQPYTDQFVAGLTPTQTAGIQNTSASATQAQPYYNAATGLTLSGAQDVGALNQNQIGYYQNPYTQAVAAPTLQALQQQQGQERSQQQAQAIKSGAAFGERAGLQRAQLAGQQGLATAQALAPIYQQGYQQAVQTAQGQQGVVAADLARRMQAGQQVAGIGTQAQQAGLQGAQAQIAAGTVEQQTQQADLTARYQQFLQQRGYDFQTAQFLANIAMGTGALSGSTTTTTQPTGFFSDERLKHDAHRIGETDDGLPIYSFKYNGDNKTQIGLMAQDVEKRKPEAVGLAPASDGKMYKTVDYDKATRSNKDYGGGVMGNYDASSMGGAVAPGLAGEGFADGGMPGVSGYVPAANLPIGKLMTADGRLLQQNKSGLASAAETGKSIAGLYDMGKTGLVGSAATSSSGEMPGLIGGGGKWKGENVFDWTKKQFAANGGLIVPRHGYATDGGVGDEEPLPYNPSEAMSGEDPMKDVLRAGSQFSKSLPKPGGSPGQGRGIGNDIMDAASLVGAGKTLYSAATALPAMFAMFSDKRLKDNIRPVGQTFDGQNIYSYNIGDGPTQMGLMAQEVLGRKPEAVGRRGEYLTVDYDRATEDASPFAYGGLVPRQGYDKGGPTEEIPAQATEVPVEQPVDDRLDRTLGALRRIESGGRYDITGPESRKGDRPYGAYQVMGANVPSWTEAAIGRRMTPEEFLKDDKAQDATARHRAGLYLKQYDDPRQVASMWLSGKPMEKAGDVADVLGTNVPKYISMFDKYYDGKDLAPRPPGVMGRSERAPFSYSGKGAGQASLGDVFGEYVPKGTPTSANFWVPALAGLGSMLASKNTTLLGAVGEGLVGGVSGYQSQYKQQMDATKTVFDIIQNTFQETRDAKGNVAFRNKRTGDLVAPQQVQASVSKMLEAAGIDPAFAGISKSTSGGLMPAQAETSIGADKGAPAAAPTVSGGPPRPEIPAGRQQPTLAGEAQPVPAKITDKPPEEWSATEIDQHVRENGAQYGLTGANNPITMQKRVDQLKARAASLAEVNPAQAGIFDKQAQEEQARLDALVTRAASKQLDNNKKISEQRLGNANDFANAIGKRDEIYTSAKSQMMELSRLQGQGLKSGFGAELQRDINSFLKTYGIDYQVGLNSPSDFDYAAKIAMQQIVSNLAAAGLQRAPRAGIEVEKKITPGGSVDPGAIYSLIGQTLGDMEYVRDRDREYLAKHRNSDPTAFTFNYNDKMGERGYNQAIAKAFSQLDLPKSDDKNIGNLVRNISEKYGPYGYRPKGIDTGQNDTAPAPTSGKSTTNVPWKVVQ